MYIRDSITKCREPSKIKINKINYILLKSFTDEIYTQALYVLFSECQVRDLLLLNLNLNLNLFLNLILKVSLQLLSLLKINQTVKPFG